MYLYLSEIHFYTSNCTKTFYSCPQNHIILSICHAHQFTFGFQHTDALVQSLFNEAVSAPIAIDKIIPSKLVDREMDNQSKTELPQNQWNIQPKQKLSSVEDVEDETTLTKISRG